MKRFFIILCVLSLICTTASARKIVDSNPDLMYIKISEVLDSQFIVERLEELKDETEGSQLIIILKVCLDKKYKKVEWTLPVKVTNDEEPYIYLIDMANNIKQEVSATSDGTVITDFTDYDPGIYYICFYVKEGA